MRRSEASLDVPERMTARSSNGTRATLTVLLMLCLAPASPLAEESASLARDTEVVGVPWTGEPAIVETVDQIMARAALLPPIDEGVLREAPEHEVYLPRRRNPLSPAVSQWPPAGPSAAVPQAPSTPQTLGVNFRALMSGPAATESNFIPPDSMGDVGPTQILAIANGRIRVFSKTGVLGPLNTTTDNFFNSVRNNQGTTDPQVSYDRLSGRWFVVMVNVASTNNRVLIAVSTGPTITGQSSFSFFQFQQNLPSPAGDSGRFADYPTLGVDRFALYIGANMFATTLADTTAFVVHKANLLAGTLTVTAFRGLTGGLNEGPFAPQGVDNDDPNATEGYFIGTSVAFFGQLDIRRVSNPGGTPTMSGNLLLIVPDTFSPLDQVALGSTVPLDALDDRLFAASIYRNKVTGMSTLWTAHNIAVDFTGTSGIAGGDRNGSRWYEIASLTGTPSLIQSGTLFDPTVAGAPRGYWMESVVGSGQGHMALGCSFASALDFAGVAVAGRFRSDTQGSTGTPTIAQVGLAAYNQAASGRNRWGDYSQTVVDPNDDMTMWTFQEYSETGNAVGQWGVRVVQLIAPPPATPSAASPSFVARNTASTPVTVTGTSVSGSEFFDPGPDTGGPGYANHIGASVSGGVTLNGSPIFDGPTQVRLDISTTGATCSTKDVTVTNPDAQSRTGAALLTTIPPPPSASNNGPICGGQTLQLMASSTVAGATYAWTGPNGFTSSQQNPSIPNATPANSGTYSAIVTVGGCDSSPATTVATVNPTPGPPAASNNGPVCQGATLELTASTVSGATYAWTGPNGFTSSQQNPSIPNATPANSGTYSVTATVGNCTSAPGTTTATVTANGAACDDGNPCTTNDTCSNGSCVGVPVVCTPSDQCHVAGTCDPATGVCSNPAAPDGTTCDDGNACTGSDACSGGICSGRTLRCDDFNDCTSDSCNPQSGCVHTPLDGTLCDDRNGCTVNDTCAGGVCVGTGISVPGEVTNLRLTDKTTIVWDSASGAGPGTVHDVARGLESEFPVGSGPSEVCIASQIPEATTSDTQEPPVGESFWYLVRGRNSCGTGTYGSASDGTVRDTTACP